MIVQHVQRMARSCDHRHRCAGEIKAVTVIDRICHMADMRRSDDTGTSGFDNRGSTSDMVPVMMGEPDLGQRPSGVLKRGQRCLRITCIDQGCGTCLRVMQQHAVIIAAIGKLMDIGHGR